MKSKTNIKKTKIKKTVDKLKDFKHCYFTDYQRSYLSKWVDNFEKKHVVIEIKNGEKVATMVISIRNWNSFKRGLNGKLARNNGAGKNS